MQLKYGEIYLYFGSKTGTAANFCKTLANEARTQGFEPVVFDLIDFKPEEFATGPKKHVAVFCMATHGEGEPTDNAAEFFKWLSADEREVGSLKNLRFSVFGLGNHQYRFFNAMGRKTSAFLAKLGGEEIYKYGEGDDDVVIEDDFNGWKKDLWTTLKQKIPPVTDSPSADSSNGSIPTKKAPARAFEVEFKTDGTKSAAFFEHPEQFLKGDVELEFMAKQWLSAHDVPIKKICELRQNHEFGSTIHVEFDIGGTNVKYAPAQNCLVFAENRDSDVQALAGYLGLDLNAVFAIKSTLTPSAAPEKKQRKVKYPFPSPISVREFLKFFCDIRGSLK